MLVICLERGAGLHMAQLMPLPLTVSCFSKIQTGFTFLVPAHPGSRGKKAVKRVCVCVSSLWNVYHNTKACFFDPPCMWFTSCSVQALSESEMLLVWTVLLIAGGASLVFEVELLQIERKDELWYVSSCWESSTYFYTMRQKQQPIFFRVHLFNTWQKLMIFSHTFRNYKLQFCAFIFGIRWELCSDSDIKRFMFTSQVMKLMITG